MLEILNFDKADMHKQCPYTLHHLGYCRPKRTVDGKNPANQMIWWISHYLQCFSTFPGGEPRISEASTPFTNHVEAETSLDFGNTSLLHLIIFVLSLKSNNILIILLMNEIRNNHLGWC